MIYKALFLNLLLFVSLSSVVSLAATNVKPRVIVTTDGESDDQSSMVRFLMYASDFDIAGIVQVNGVQKNGHSKEKWIEGLIDRYDQCLPNLRKHNPDYPDKAYLLSVLKVGNENSADLGKSPTLISDNEGAQLIIKVLTDDDPRPVHILAWGGANTQANALWQIKTNYSTEVWKKAAAKARLYCIWYQDGGGLWIQKNLPEVKMYASCVTVDVNNSTYKNNDASWRYVWDYMSVDYYFKDRLSQNPKEIQTIMDKPWLAANIKIGHGPLAAAYPQEYTSEGDSPSFMALINNGLQQDTNYTLGGWGGRPVPFPKLKSILVDGGDDKAGKEDFHYTFYRWLPAIQNDWAARADWCVMSYEKANHPPVVLLDHPSDRNTKHNRIVKVSAKGTHDPDGDELIYRWWQYEEADTYEGSIEIQNADKQNASFVTPADAKVGDTIHIICEVSDKGSPQLTRYQRVVFTIKE